MPQQTVTAELRRWIIDQATAGHPVDVVLDAMKASGWEEAIALDALETTMRGHLGLPADAEVPAVGSARPMPGMRIGADRPSLRAGDRDVRVVMAMTSPRVVVFADLLAADECAELIALARARLERSETVQTATGGSEINAARTSDGMTLSGPPLPWYASVPRSLCSARLK